MHGAPHLLSKEKHASNMFINSWVSDSVAIVLIEIMLIMPPLRLFLGKGDKDGGRHRRRKGMPRKWHMNRRWWTPMWIHILTSVNVGWFAAHVIIPVNS